MRFPTSHVAVRYLLILTLLYLIPLALPAQRVLLFEKLTDSKSERIFEGDPIRFKMKGDDFWQEGYIRELRPDIQAMVINDRYILLSEIAIVDRGKTVAAVAGAGLMTFGVGWSFWGLLGYTLDDDPNTNYSKGDALVTATAVGTGYLLASTLGKRRFRPGKYRRLRIVDLSF